MWELLQKIEKLGWKPYGKSIAELSETEKNVRLITSRNSGLWQFVCENGMIRITETNSLCNWLFGEEIYYDETQTDKLYKNDNYEYWIIESALCDEDKLEQFLLDNIKI